MSYTSTMYHIVLRTHRSERTISEAHERDGEDLCQFCHIAFSLHPIPSGMGKSDAKVQHSAESGVSLLQNDV